MVELIFVRHVFFEERISPGPLVIYSGYVFTKEMFLNYIYIKKIKLMLIST